MSPPDHQNDSLMPIMSQELGHALYKVLELGLWQSGTSEEHGELSHNPHLRLFDEILRKLSRLAKKLFRGSKCLTKIILTDGSVRKDLNLVLITLSF